MKGITWWRKHGAAACRFVALFLREDRFTEPIWRSFECAQIFPVVADAFNHACDTETPQGVAALVEIPSWTLDSLLAPNHRRLVILAGLQDPGNVGTIIRSAEAFAATGVLMTPGSVSPWNQKALRASAGSSFRLPIVTLEDSALLQRLRDKQIPLYACVPNAGISIFEADLRGQFAFIIGNEGAGISDEILSMCQATVHVPCPGNVESLNAAIAASVLLCEASRQRGQASVEHKP